MNCSDSNNSPEKSSITSSTTPASEDSVQSIDAEIVENDRSSSNSIVNVKRNPIQRRSVKVYRVVKLLPASYEAIPEAERTTRPDRDRNWLDDVMTPWTIASMLLVLGANILLGFSQLSRPNQMTAEQDISKTATPSTQQLQTLSTPKNLDLATEKPDRLDVEVLSQVKPDSAGKSSTPTASSQIPPAQAKAIAAKPTPRLTQALLPPSVQPQQIIQTYTLPPSLPVASLQVPSQPPQPSSHVQQLQTPPPPVISSTQSVQQAQTVPTLPQNADPMAEFSQRHAAEQRRLEAENLPTPSLYQKTRLEGIAKQNQLNPDGLIRYFQQQQKEQILNSTNGESAASSQQPAISNQPLTTNNPQPSTIDASPSNKGRPLVEMNNDGSVEIRSNSLR
ncbi:hypothetical protein NIES593_15355 [Hydrococcus rivularis NIES-593]|uniref:Uncharacterized protein n=1 Tax=Hydrococcus rivularis NIES-593 TaxID=1921803 RepID=A0A1U7HDH1_9CYAN|nr:hypothetical protein [Hydrococcus rivularis]OKH21591.1 hypothetical protein NIES593_15355 [Hydrococcus rivularis NIES-593]